MIKRVSGWWQQWYCPKCGWVPPDIFFSGCEKCGESGSFDFKKRMARMTTYYPKWWPFQKKIVEYEYKEID